LINILVIAEETELIKELIARLARSGLSCSVAIDTQQALKQAEDRPPDLILADINNAIDMRQAMDISSGIGMTKNPLVMLIVLETMLDDVASNTGLADFIIKPCNINELFIRVQRLVKRIKNIDSKNVIRCGDLVIDKTSCEVFLGGRLVELTFKEYELLRFLAASKGQVFSREALLNKVWKYDYLGAKEL